MRFLFELTNEQLDLVSCGLEYSKGRGVLTASSGIPDNIYLKLYLDPGILRNSPAVGKLPRDTEIYGASIVVFPRNGVVTATGP